MAADKMPGGKTAEMNDAQDPIFLLCCVKVEKHYYDKHFRKQVLSFKKNHKISSNVLHSTDIRKTRFDGATVFGRC